MPVTIQHGVIIMQLPRFHVGFNQWACRRWGQQGKRKEGQKLASQKILKWLVKMG